MKYLMLFLLSTTLTAQAPVPQQPQPNVELLQAKYKAAMAEAKWLYTILAPFQQFQDYMRLANQDIPALQRQLQQAQEAAVPKPPAKK